MYEQLFRHQEEVFKVIASQKRLELIQLLTHGELAVNEMVDMLGISQSNVSQHLGLLRRVGIVKTRKDGKTVRYSLKDPRIAEACSLIRQFLIGENKVDNLDMLEGRLDSLYPIVHDPVCGMRMGPAEVAERHRHQDETYYFCAAGCVERFKKNPATFISNELSMKG